MPVLPEGVHGFRPSFTHDMNAARSFFCLANHSARRSTHSGAPDALVVLRPIHSFRDPGACVCALQACASTGDVLTGKKVHSWVVVNSFQASPFVNTSLINFYSKCSCPGDALAVFRHVECPNVFQWNAVISGFVANGLPEEALELYSEMDLSGTVPDRFTYPCLVKACSELEEGPLAAGSIHGRLFKIGLESDVFICSALINAYLKMGSMAPAKKLFDRLSDRDVVLWNSMVNGFAQVGSFEDALEFFQRMRIEGFTPNNFTITGMVSVLAATGDFVTGSKIHGLAIKSASDSYIAVSNSLIDMYGKCQHLEAANFIFELMPYRDVFSWNSMISASEQSGDHRRTLILFDRMKDSGILPDAVTVSAVLPACAHMAALFHGRMIHGFLMLNGLRNRGDTFLENAVMDMYAKCGKMDDARSVFDTMDGRDAASWNIMIGGYALHGDGVRTMDMFARMRAAFVAPDEVTFVNVLSGCSHAGLVDRGREILGGMEPGYGVTPTVEHYACVVDMLGRAGRLTEAYDLAAGAPVGFSPVLWISYLAACRAHGDMERSVQVARRLLEVEPKHSGIYVLLSNTYSSAGRFGDVLETRRAMRHRNVRKAPGCSWIEVGSLMHVFFTGDRHHMEVDEIYAELHLLIGQLREFGYVPDVRLGE